MNNLFFFSIYKYFKKLVTCAATTSFGKSEIHMGKVLNSHFNWLNDTSSIENVKYVWEIVRLF